LEEVWVKVNHDLTIVLTFWGSKGVGKSWTTNVILAQLLGLSIPPERFGKVPVPSLAGFDDGSPWPIIIR